MRQALTKRLDEPKSVLLGLMSDVQIDHGRIDLLMTKEPLDAVQAGPALDQVSRVTVTEGMNRGVGNIKLFAGENQEALKRAVRHGRLGGPHPGNEFGAALDPPSSIRENQERVTMDPIISTQILQHIQGKGNDAVLPALALTNDQLLFGAFDVVDGEREALRKSQAAAINQFDGNAIAAQPNMTE